MDSALAWSVSRVDRLRMERDYWKHDELAVLDGLIPPEVLAPMQQEILALAPRVKRKGLVGYKAAGSLSYYVLQEYAPTVLALYQSPALLDFISRLSDVKLGLCPENDPHACAVYWYDRPGDRVGFHRDISHYRGARYTLLIGIEDGSSGRLQCRLYARDRFRQTVALDVATGSGRMVFFNGDKLLHAVSPIAQAERRIVLALQYLENPEMAWWRRIVSTLKDALTYFGMDAFRGRGLPRFPR